MFKTLFCFLCISIGLSVVAQEDDTSNYYDTERIEKQRISEEDLKAFSEDEDFNYSESLEQDENIIDTFFKWLQNILIKIWEAIFGVGSATGIILTIFRILPYLLLGFLLFLLIKFFLRLNSNTIKTGIGPKGSITISEEENIIKHEDISELIRVAIEQNNYRLAIRYYYLLCLKALTENDSIEWQPDKTNSDYLNEIKTSVLKNNFKQITKIYDYVWYGEFNIDFPKFELLKQPFINLQHQIQKS